MAFWLFLGTNGSVGDGLTVFDLVEHFFVSVLAVLAGLGLWALLHRRRRE